MTQFEKDLIFAIFHAQDTGQNALAWTYIRILFLYGKTKKPPALAEELKA